RQGAPNTRLEIYIQLRRVTPTTTGQNKKTLHLMVFQRTVRREINQKRRFGLSHELKARVDLRCQLFQLFNEAIDRSQCS
ncbi:hypothetical protein, partial [Bradyrhizobium sp. sBnM-33]|uniref:hypothetical protein n=1 Tax=Bradyrhizobium sp. sBnM-33 TaxID=2831780 RepID=UPI001BCEE38B